MIYYIKKYKNQKDTAGSKAPRDIYILCEKMGMKAVNLSVYDEGDNKFLKTVKLIWETPKFWKKLEKDVNEGDVIFYQHPLYGEKSGLYGYKVAEYHIRKMRRQKKCKFIALIHDLDSIRKKTKRRNISKLDVNKMADDEFLKYFDAIICHNEHMKQYMIERGFNGEKLISIKIFDYLCSCDNNNYSNKKDRKPSIAIAGNLRERKSAYIYKIFGDDTEKINDNLIVHLYGSNFNADKATGNIIYHGSIDADKLPGLLEGEFGLVWDGNSIKTCEGSIGNYLKYNNPHKLSLYLASGIPVIVWDQAAIADFVCSNGVGIAVNSLYDLDDVISNISQDEYQTMCKQAYAIGEKVRLGCYFTSAFEKSIEILDKV